jgi:membrane protease YdiL (CAAX protease family)
MIPYGWATFDLLAFRPASVRFVLAGTAGALVLSLVVSPLSLQSDWQQELADIIREPGQLLVGLMVIGGLGPVTEELVFRGLLYGWLAGRWGRALP